MDDDAPAAYNTAVADDQTIAQFLLRSSQQRDATPSALASSPFAIVQAQLNAAHPACLSQPGYDQQSSLELKNPCHGLNQHLTGKMRP